MFWRYYLNKIELFSTLKELAKRDKFAFEKRIEFLNHWHFLTYRDIPTLRLSAWEFDFPKDCLRKQEYVGPMVHLERVEDSNDDNYQHVIREVDAKRKTGGKKTRSVVFCSMGTLISNYGYFQRVIHLFAHRNDWDLILTVGGKISLENFRSIPTNVYLFKRVPQLDVLRRADVFLTHGGIGSIHEAILLGVPMVVYSGGVMDENGNAARVEYHGLGLRGNIEKDTPEQIENKIEEVLSNPEYQGKVKKMQEIFLNYHRSDQVVGIIEETFQNGAVLTV
jgi:UDP:flavonoid glycosyltransferase YjiC (YdhE family)